MKSRTALVACCSLPLAVGAASAQELLPTAPAGSSTTQQSIRTAPEAASARGETVATRSRPELDPLGIRAGSFLIYPKIGVSETWNDNIFAEREDTKQDFITDVRPSVAVESNWANHALDFSTGADFGFYSNYSRQDYTDYFAETNGRLDILRDSTLYAGAGYAREHEEPGEPDFPTDAKTPTEYDLYTGYLRHVQRFSKLRGIAEANVVRLDYDKINTVSGEERSSADRDRTVYSGGYRIGYDITPQYEVFVRGEGNRRQYDMQEDAGGIDRTSTGFSAVTGLSLDLGGVTFGDIFIGWMEQYYADGLNDIGGLTAGGTLTWNVTTLTTLNTRVTRQIADTTQTGSAGIVRTTGGITADHELLRNLILTTAVTVTNDDYADISRNDYYYVGGIGARYLMNRNIYGTLGYQIIRHTTSGSDSGNNSYFQNLVRIGLEAQL